MSDSKERTIVSIYENSADERIIVSVPTELIPLAKACKEADTRAKYILRKILLNAEAVLTQKACYYANGFNSDQDTARFVDGVELVHKLSPILNNVSFIHIEYTSVNTDGDDDASEIRRKKVDGTGSKTDDAEPDDGACNLFFPENNA